MTPRDNNNELSWKNKDGSYTPIENLTDDQLKEFRVIAAKKSEIYFYQKKKYIDLNDFFSDLLAKMDKELDIRIEQAEADLESLQNIEALKQKAVNKIIVLKQIEALV